MTLTPQMVTIDCADPGKLAAFWTAAVGYEIVEAMSDAAYVVLRGSDRRAIALALQQVPEPRTGKNRVHVDWRADDRAAEVARLQQLGATVLAEHTLGTFTWTVLADPEGNEFCVSG